MFEWAYAGVDHTLPGNGGEACVNFIPLWQRFAESGLACLFAACCIKYAYKRVTLPEVVASSDKAGDCGKRILLVSMCLTFGVELGFKFATRQFIWIFNPCHVTSMIQIFILAAPPGRLVTAMFRLHMYMLTGAPIAILLPVINTRLLPFETEVYFIQHILMMIIPFYLMSIGGVYKVEKLKDMSWALLALGWLYFFHFVPLNYLAVLSKVNLNNMLCPAVSDPFYGRLYRIYAMGHQVILLPLIGKLLAASCMYFNITPDTNFKEIPVFKKQRNITSDSSDSSRHIGGNDKIDNEIKNESLSKSNGNHTEQSCIRDRGDSTSSSKDSGVAHRNGMTNHLTEAATSVHTADSRGEQKTHGSSQVQGNGHSKQL